MRLYVGLLALLSLGPVDVGTFVNALGRVPSPVGDVLAIQWDPSGRFLAVQGPEGAALLNPDMSLRCRRSEAGAELYSGQPGLSLSPDGQTLMLSQGENSDVSNGESSQILASQDCRLLASVAGRGLAYLSPEHVLIQQDGELKSLSWSSGQGQSLGLPKAAIWALSPQRDRLAYLKGQDQIVVLDRLSGQILARLKLQMETQQSLSGLHFSPDGRTLAIQLEGPSANLRIWHLDRPAPEAFSLSGLGNYLAAFSPDGRFVAISSWATDEMFVLWLDLKLGQVLRSWAIGDPVSALAFHPDGRQLTVGNSDGNALIHLSLEHSRPPDAWIDSRGQPHHQAEMFTPPQRKNGQIQMQTLDGLYHIALSDDYRLRVWRMKDQKLILDVPVNFVHEQVISYLPAKRSLRVGIGGYPQPQLAVYQLD
ncbi:MAG: hypothetical protein CVV27_00785 [Candidatus Melainabacteria bacterium HGW-Melainabacteria-1]|nr:MAG: hypothetical protein CVV27_00785 [Candidatus Melainabacteria bacterium HGW-Melainabacteria-1]